MTWNELYDRIARTLGKRRVRVHVPFSVARAGALVTERLPNPPLTRDQVAMLEDADSVCDATPALETFEIGLLPLDEQLRLVI